MFRPQPPTRLPRHARRHDVLLRALLQRHRRPRRRPLLLQLELGRRGEHRPMLLQPGMHYFTFQSEMLLNMLVSGIIFGNEKFALGLSIGTGIWNLSLE